MSKSEEVLALKYNKKYLLSICRFETILLILFWIVIIMLW